MSFLEAGFLAFVALLSLGMFGYAFSVGSRASQATRRNHAIRDSIRDMRRRERAF